MSRIKQVELGMDATIPTAQFENYKPSVKVTVEVAEEDDLQAAIKKGWDVVEAEMRAQVMELVEFRNRQKAEKAGK